MTKIMPVGWWIAALLEYGFRNFKRHVYAQPGDAVGRAEVRGGREPEVPVVCQKTLSSVSGPGMDDDVRLEVTVAPLEAPVAAGTPAGEARLVAGGQVLASSPLLSAGSVSRSRLHVSGLWFLRAVVIVGLLLLLSKAYGKTVKANRRRGSHLAA